MTWPAAAGVTARLFAKRIQEPTLIGEVTLKTRSMLKKRSRRPRSAIRSIGLAETPANAISQARLASRRLPVRVAAYPRAEEAPPRPPAKKYHGISGFQTGGLTTLRS